MRTSDVQYKQREQGDFTIIELSGRIDLSSSPGFRRQLLNTITHNNNLLIDLSRVSYIDSSGVACLVEAYQAARTKSLQFGLVGVTDPVRNVLRLSRLERMFPMHDTMEAASRRE